jgi:hypothetical protein
MWILIPPNPAIVAVCKIAAVPVDVLSRVWGEVEFLFEVGKDRHWYVQGLRVVT